MKDKKKKKKDPKTFSERVKTSQIQRIKSKIGHGISNHEGKLVHKGTKLTCILPTFFYLVLHHPCLFRLVIVSSVQAIFKHQNHTWGKRRLSIRFLSE